MDYDTPTRRNCVFCIVGALASLVAALEFQLRYFISTRYKSPNMKNWFILAAVIVAVFFIGKYSTAEKPKEPDTRTKYATPGHQEGLTEFVERYPYAHTPEGYKNWQVNEVNKEKINATIYNIEIKRDDVGLQYFIYHVRVSNQTNKAIKAVECTFSITDLFDNELKHFTITLDKKEIPANNYNEQTFAFRCNPYISEDAELKNKIVSDNDQTVKVIPKINNVIFTDGSYL